MGVLWSRRRRWTLGEGGGGYIGGILPLNDDSSSLSGGWVAVKVPHTSKAKGKLYVQSLEGPGVNSTGGAFPTTAPLKLRHALAHGKDYKESKDRQVKPGDGDGAADTVRGAGAEGGKYKVHSV